MKIAEKDTLSQRRPRPAHDETISDAAGASHRGPRVTNEDRFAVLDRLGRSDGDRGLLLVVADGIGGLPGGAAASQIALERFVRSVEEPFTGPGTAPGPEERLEHAVRAAHRALVEHVASHPELEEMGTTLTAALVGERRAWIAHVGDSRAYLVRHRRPQRLTRDDTVAERLQDQGMEADGLDARWGHVLTNAVSADRPPEVEVASVGLSPGDRLVLCTDGVTGTVSDDDLAGLVAAAEDAAEAASGLVEEALARGGRDNATAVVACYRPDSRRH